MEMTPTIEQAYLSLAARWEREQRIDIPESWFVCRLCRWRMDDKPDAVQRRCKHEWMWKL